MQKNIYISIIIAFVLLFTGCGTSRVAYDSGHAVSTAAVSGTGSIVGSITTDADKSLNLVLGTVGNVVEGSGKVIGGSIGIAGGLVDKTGSVISGVNKNKKKNKKKND
jgi:hypothetical protein